MIAFGKPFINMLKDNELTLKEYFILYCYAYDKVYLLREYINVETISMKDVARLVGLKYLMVKREVDDVNLDGFKVASKGIRFIKSMVDSFQDAKADNLLLGDEDLDDLALEKYNKEFIEFYEAYPATVIRMNGNESTLRLQKKLCKELYIGILKSNKFTHHKMLDIVKYYIKQKTNNNSLQYLKTLKNYLRDEVYVDVNDHMELKSQNNNNNKNINYGGKIV